MYNIPMKKLEGAMAQRKLTINLPGSVEALHNVLQVLLQYGLISEKTVHTIEQEEAAKKRVKKSRWAQLADEIHQEAPLKGKSGEFLKLAREFRENFSF
jgi:hypothetical protein